MLLSYGDGLPRSNPERRVSSLDLSGVGLHLILPQRVEVRNVKLVRVRSWRERVVVEHLYFFGCLLSVEGFSVWGLAHRILQDDLKVMRVARLLSMSN